jgi:hypothetical protein
MRLLRRKIVLLLIFLSLANIRCGVPVDPELVYTSLPTLIKIAGAVIKLIKEFNEGNNNLNATVITVSKKTTDKLSAQTDLVKVAGYWEKKWDAIILKNGQLNNLLTVINNTSLDYFKKLEKNNELIKFDSIGKKQDLERTEALKKSWIIEYTNASKDMANIGLMIQKANDFKIELTNTVARDSLKKSFDKLAQLSSQAKELASDINEFSINARAIFRVENIPNYDIKKNHAVSVRAPKIARKHPANDSADLSKPDNYEREAKKESAGSRRLASCRVNQLWIQNNALNYSRRGIDLHINLDIINMSGISCKCIAKVFYNNGDPLKFRSTGADPQVSAVVFILPKYPDSRFNNLVIPLPYNYLPKAPGNYNLKASVRIYNMSDINSPQKIGESGFARFNYTVN